MGLGGRDDLRRSHHLQLSRQRQRTHSFRNTQGNREQVWTQVSHWVSKLQAVDNSIGDTVPVIKPSVTVLRWHSAASPFILSLLKFVMLSYFFVLPLKNVCVCVCVCVCACVRACVRVCARSVTETESNINQGRQLSFGSGRCIYFSPPNNAPCTFIKTSNDFKAIRYQCF